MNMLSDKDQIAIVGMAGRFPGANNVDKFWQNIRDGVESISFFTDEEILSAGVNPALLNDPSYVKAQGVLENIELFDAAFFGFSPREAEITDPQQRLFIECVWEALENAGYSSQTYDGQIGVFAGVAASNYLLSNLYSNRELIESADNFQILLGNDKDFLSTHISYKLNLRGPSINIQTACSTSLVTVHLACQSLLNGESDIALAGGVSIRVPQKTGYYYQEGGIKSPDGHCRAFDAKAKGTNDGNGLGVVVLKRLDDAITDGDFIHAIIKGSAINNDGSLKVGYTAPSVNGQREVILEALALAGVEPETIAYIETHGTGTQLGDPIEIKALTQAFRASTDKKGFCAIASVKTNIGHLDTAAGVTGLIKTVQVLKHQQIPSSLHFQEPNPQIDFANSPFYVNTKLSEWKTHNSIPRRAGVSSFGIGGTNAHVILEEAPVLESFSSSRPWQLLLLSAKTSTALETTTANLVAHLQQHPDINLPDVAHTLQVGRWAFEHRRMVVCRNLDDARKLLNNPDLEGSFTYQKGSSHCPVIFMFSGQGAQYVNMARELYEVEPTFRNYVDTCAKILQPYLNLDIRHIVYPTENTEVASQQLQQTALTQPVLFVIEYALAQLWIEWGVRPEAMIGHSIGEYVAATIAGVFSLEDALAVVATRGQLMQQLPTGSMLAIPLPEKDVQDLLDIEPLYKKYLQIAAINSQSSCVVSGSHDAIATLKNQLSIKKIECRLLHTSHAFHSQMMTPILELFVQTLEKLKLRPPKIRFISNVTGTWITDEQATNPSYWSQHLRQTVRFSDGISQLLQQFEGIFLEVGPGRTLSTLTTQHLNNKAKQQVLTSLCHAKEQQSDVSFLLQTLGKLWLFGVNIDWSGFYANEQRYRIPLPTYPFERQRYWIDAKPPLDANSKLAILDKKEDIANWFYIPSWKRSLLSPSSSPQIDSAREWLLFVDEFGVSDKLSNKLKNQDKNVTVVKPGEDFGNIGEGIYTINPYNRYDYEALFEKLIALNKIPQNIAFFWNLNNFDNQQHAEYLEFNTLLLLTQCWSKFTINGKLQLWVISNQIQEVTGNEIINPEKAIILGLCKVIPQEYPNITCRSIDVNLINEEGREYNNYIIDQIFREFSVLSSDLVVAYRDRYRWVQVFAPVRLESVVEEKIPLKKQGVYLFFGGLESVAFVLAEYLAKIQATLILIENSAFPQKDDYSQWLKTHSQEDEVSCKIEKLLILEQLGAKILLVRGDITNYDHMHQNLASENIGEIHGVIYSNGITHKDIFCSIPEISKLKLEKVLQSQRDRIGVLEQVLQNRKLDFGILLSSLSPILGGFGLALDSAINLFTNTFISQNKVTHSLPWYTINLEFNAIQEEKILGKASTLIESVEVFKRILSLGERTEVIVSTVDINARSDRTFNFDSLLDSKSSVQVDLSSRYSRPNLSNSYVAPTNELEKQIVEIWQEVLGISQVGIYDNFYDLGGDSLIATQLVSRLRAKFSVELPLRELLEALIVAKQAEIIEELLLEKIEELSEEEVALLLADG
ncbi:MAG: acyltransferase domain-containing protein [Spirirestis rafaelensis WJT71-NPBG6]|nr:acyltransferase domain-containing protein [Spirirestis rafaelensis WJT71-NPBG6]